MSYLSVPNYKNYKDFFNLKTLYKTKFAFLSNGETIGYRDEGKSEFPILMIHGNYTCGTTFEKVIQ